MAKRGGQLHVDVSNDDEWDAVLLRDGLLVVDIYSDWCGPCSGMSANLKKIKLEVAGDSMVMVLAKCDKITALERFRLKSEPTWMFISKGKMTNLIFGTNAPEITRIVLSEVAKEQHAADTGLDQREKLEISQLHPIEVGRFEEAMLAKKLAIEKEEARRLKNIYDRKRKECMNILNNLALGVILVFPCATNKYTDCVNDFVKEASCSIFATERAEITMELLDEMFYFYDKEEPAFDEITLEEILTKKSVLVAIKGSHSADTSNFEALMCHIVYGKNSQGPPGDRYCFYEKTTCEVEDEETGEVQLLPGVWIPHSAFIRATMLRLFFHKFTENFEIPDPGPTPPHYAMVFDTNKIKDALHCMSKWPKQILHYGFFTNENPAEAELVAKSVQRLELPDYRAKRTYEEKLVMAVSKKKSELLLDLIELEPVYMSMTTEDGEKDREMFFPDDYADSLPDEELVYIEPPEEEMPEEEEEEGMEGD
ncbi:unnamed protein product [Phyllotreta striolata]|uniref:Uncharacterized protein n=1 Tax=Phyllotreta striolata TaxID=444603 RepID=A0A9N9XPX3_PHYSR|nr:unnamed protein product [Phyllotreta striolata]